MIRISFIIPTLNEEDYIRSTLEAISNQTIPREEYEIIVIDSRSTDNTVKISEEYADEIISEKNKNISNGRNKGAELARGKILIFIDADTIIEPTLAEKVLKKFQDERIAGAYVRYIYSFKSKILKLINNLAITLLTLFHSVNNNCIIISGACLIVRRVNFNKINGFNEKLETSEDIKLYHDLKKTGKFVFIDETVQTSTRRFKKMGWFATIKYYLTDVYNHSLKKDYKGEYKTIR